MPPASPILSPGSDGAVLLNIKAVPGAKRDAIAGPLGERLKIRVAQPPEGGKANRAICELLAAELGLRPAAITIIRGQTSAEKTLRIEGALLETIASKLLK